jgi:hypothetical protein
VFLKFSPVLSTHGEIDFSGSAPPSLQGLNEALSRRCTNQASQPLRIAVDTTQLRLQSFSLFAYTYCVTS